MGPEIKTDFLFYDKDLINVFFDFSVEIMSEYDSVINLVQCTTGPTHQQEYMCIH